MHTFQCLRVYFDVMKGGCCVRPQGNGVLFMPFMDFSSIWPSPKIFKSCPPPAWGHRGMGGHFRVMLPPACWDADAVQSVTRQSLKGCQKPTGRRSGPGLGIVSLKPHLVRFQRYEIRRIRQGPTNVQPAVPSFVHFVHCVRQVGATCGHTRGPQSRKNLPRALAFRSRHISLTSDMTAAPEKELTPVHLVVLQHGDLPTSGPLCPGISGVCG